MAEAVGVALGTLALLSTFKDCIDLFSTISAIKSLGLDYEILNTKLDIEKTLLLQWVDRVRLLHPKNYDRRLNDARTNKVVSSILASIKLLLSETTGLQTRYGLKPVEKPRDGLTREEMQTTIIPSMSVPRMKQFRRDFDSLSLRVHATQRESSIKQRCFWVVRDKEKFSGLVRELSGFIGKLNAVIPATQEPIELMTRKDLENIIGLRQVQLVLEAAKEHEVGIVDLAHENITQRCQQRVLDCLWYPMIDERRSNVAQAHFKTLQWALSPPTPEVEWDDLSEWLRSGSGVYWVSGKAGSGKSTLMKYLYQNSDARAALETWATGWRLIMANFFFWNLGTPEQKNLEGLSRGLLYYVLDTDRSLIPQILPTMWREAHNAENGNMRLPSSGEMGEAFSKLKFEVTKHKFCFYIDGLDEYTGSPQTGVAFISSLISSGNIKVVVSSRPTPACVQEFSDGSKLQLQDLTRDDIKTYINDTIGSHRHIQDLMTMDPKAIQKIFGDLVNKASGVFLWVILACRSLLEGFAAFDYPDELQRRVDELPPELESLFKHILNRIEPRYQIQAAKLLKICHQKRIYPEAEPSSQNFDISDGIYTLGLALVDEHELDMRHVPELRPLTLDEKRMKCKVLEARLRSRCCGLVEVQKASGRKQRCFCGHQPFQTGRSFYSPIPENVLAEPTAMTHGLVDSMVEFMHRTVFEFLSNPEVWSLDCLQVPDNNFDANAVISRMSLQLAYVAAREEKVDATIVNELLTEAIFCAQYADESSGNIAASILYSFSQISAALINALGQKADFNYAYPCFGEIKKYVRSSKKAMAQLALVLAVELGLTNAVKRFALVGLLSHTQDTNFLWHAIDRPLTNWLPTFWLDVSPKMIELLLLKGIDPNTTFMRSSRHQTTQTTPWKCWLQYMRSSHALGSASVAAEVTELFLKGGADVNVHVSDPTQSIEDLIEQRLIASIDNVLDLELVFTRDQRAVRTRYDDILQLIARKRIRENTQMDPAWQDRTSKDWQATRAVSPKASTHKNLQIANGEQRKRLNSTSEMPSGLADRDQPDRSIKRRKVLDEREQSEFRSGIGTNPQ